VEDIFSTHGRQSERPVKMPPEPVTHLISSTGVSPRLAAALAYSGWWVTGLLFWFLERRDTYVRFHAAQSVAAFGLIAMLIGGFALMAAASLSFLPSAFPMFLGAAAVTWIVGVVLWALAMWKAATGHPLRIPIASELADRLVKRNRV
jgi:uncharacterized membrane protein